MRSVWNIVSYYRSQILSDPVINEMPTAIIQARAFENVLSNIPIKVNPDQTIAGDFGWKCLNEVQRRKLNDKINTLPSLVKKPDTPQKTLNLIMRDRFFCYGDYCLAHTCANYENIITHGVKGILERINQSAQNDGEQKQVYLEAMKITLNALCDWAQRYARTAQQAADQCDNPKQKKNLLCVAENCARVPYHRPENFQQAVQAIWLLHAAVGISELSDEALSLGRLDQYLYPIYCHTIDMGSDTLPIAKNIEDLLRKLNRYGDIACTINLGGLDSENRDMLNPLSWLIMSTAKKLRMPSPILAARIHKDIPVEFFDSLLDPKLATIDQPVFYGETPCTNALIERGVSKSVVHDFAANSSTGLVMPGMELANMRGGVVNCLLPLELTLNSGKPWSNDLPFNCKTKPKEFYKSFDELLEQYFNYLDEIIFFCITENRHATKLAAKVGPNPYLSALLDDCIDRGLDRANGGTRYHLATIEGFGLTNASDAITAIKKLVFDNHNFPLKRIINAVMDDFESAPGIQQALLGAPKYGNSDRTADEIAKHLAEKFADLVRKYSNAAITYAPSLSTGNMNIQAGKLMGASPDGRGSAEPLARNISTIPRRCRKGNTALVLSASYIDQKKFFGGQALDLYIDIESLGSLEFKKQFQELIQTYFKMGGLAIQIKASNTHSLGKHARQADLYENTLLKITGYPAELLDLEQNYKNELT